ncbi:molybdopterin-binding protein [Herbiconiux sp. P15]|uniref:molybdopterin-binding protein n=1 Tax=Herbiconiux liukaitaii TaxID=3342799 RepID=UPI0035B99354
MTAPAPSAPADPPVAGPGAGPGVDGPGVAGLGAGPGGASPVDWFVARRIAHAAGAQARATSDRGAEVTPLETALARVVAAPVAALCDIPHYASSAMDGWAVSGAPPWRLTGASPVASEHSSTAVPIVTGGVVPSGTWCVLRSEFGELTASGEGGDGEGGEGDRAGAVTASGEGEPGDGEVLLALSADAPPGELRQGRHIRPPATEAHLGETVIAARTVLTPVHLALAAAAGHDALPLAPRPRVSLLLTGDEVVTSGIPAPGRVRDSFSLTLPPLLAAQGADVSTPQRVPDDLPSTLAALTHPTLSAPPMAIPGPTASGTAATGPTTSTADGPTISTATEPRRVDLVVTTGGTGGSGSDHVRAALLALGAELLVDGIAVRPGAPALLARLPTGVLVAALPGNPLAALLTLHALVHPLLAGWQGCDLPELIEVTTAVDLAPHRAPLSLRPYRLTHPTPTPTAPTAPTGAAGPSVVAEPSEWQGSAMLRGLADADGVLLVPSRGAAAGERLQAIALR